MLVKSKAIAEVWDEFKAMRKKKKKPLTEAAESRQWNRVKKLIDAGLSENDIISHLHDVCDSMWDNVYSNDEHFNNIVSKYLKPTNNNGAKTTSKTGTKHGSNYYTYHKGTAYEQTAANLLAATTGYDFVGQIRP